MANFDPLLESLNIICKQFDIRFTSEAALAGLPLVEGRLTPTLFVPAAEQVGVSAELRETEFTEFERLALPAVLILQNNHVCVLTKCLPNNTFEIIRPEQPDQTVALTAGALATEFGGYVITTTPELQVDARVADLTSVDKPSWFWEALARNRRIYLHVVIAAFLSNLFVLVAPLFVMNVYDRVVPNQAITTLWVLATGAFIFFIFDLLSRMLRQYLVDVAGRSADRELSARLFKQLLGLRMANKPGSSGGVATYFAEFEALQDFFTSASFVGLIDLPFILLYLIAIFLIGGSLVVIPFVAIPLTIACAYLLERPSRIAIQKALTGVTFRQAMLVEAMNGLGSIKAFNAEGPLQRRWESSVEKTSEASAVSRFYSALTMNITVWIQQLVVVAVVIYGVYMIIDGDLSVGGLIACTILAGRALMLGQVASLLNRWERSRTALKGLNKIMQMPTDRSTRKDFLRRPDLKGEIHAENLSFFYPNSRIAALDHVNLEIKPGERVGIIGRIGSGKSTLLKLINGMYSPNEGYLRVDGTENSDIDPYDLRRKILLVADDSSLFYGSVRDNIILGNPLAEDEAILHAAHLAGVDKFVQLHPLGYDMPVGERGELLSSGQRQAVILARAFLMQPSVLMLDEPTGAMDNGFEQEFMQSLPTYLNGKTLIVVTHRASVLELVDRVIVMDGGRLVADGPKEVIMSKLMQPKAN